MNDLIWALHAKTSAEKETKKAIENKIELKKEWAKRGVWYLIYPCLSRYITIKPIKIKK